MAAPKPRDIGHDEILAVPSVGPTINRHLIYENVIGENNIFSGEPEAPDRHRFTPTEFFRTQGVKPVGGASVRFSHTEYEVSAFPATGNPGWRPPLPRREAFLSRLTYTPGQREAPPRMAARIMGLDGVGELIANPDRRGRTQLRTIRRQLQQYDLLQKPRQEKEAELAEKQGKKA
jgi:hypothetical protein